MQYAKIYEHQFTHLSMSSKIILRRADKKMQE